jgi:DNA-binding GntR family transcriptional regulator
MLDISDHLPLYIQVASTLRERIDAGEFVPHTPLPSEPELLEIYKVSRATVRSALDFLRKGGRIYTQHGKGTYVCDPVSRCPCCKQVLPPGHKLSGEIPNPVEHPNKMLTLP